MDISSFKQQIDKFAKSYNNAEFFKKITAVAKKAGTKLVYAALLLYYASLDKNIPIKDRALIIGALGYFILPVDFIPDALPLGFTDDMAALTYVLKTVWGNLTPEVHQRARHRLEEWFGPVSDSDLRIPGL